MKKLGHLWKPASAQKEPFYTNIRNITGYRPKDITLYERVFTHRSLEKIDEDGNKINYERLEFLGDALLGALIGAHLYNTLPKADEGVLTQMRSKIVRRDFLNHVGKALQLYPMLQSNVGKDKYGDDIHGNLLEALVGAVFIDAGFRKCSLFVNKKVIGPYVDLAHLKGKVLSHKSLLVNWFQQQKKDFLFDVYEDSGALAAPHYKSKLLVNGKVIATARGSSKKKAMEKVSQRAYFKLKDKIEGVG
jgi:ribonuclease-3